MKYILSLRIENQHAKTSATLHKPIKIITSSETNTISNEEKTDISEMLGALMVANITLLIDKLKEKEKENAGNE